MDRRELLGVLGAGTAGLIACGGVSAAVTGNAQQQHDEHIKTIDECAKVCNQASHHCLEEMSKGGSHNELHAKSHAATIDCQEFCRVTAALMARSSSHGEVRSPRLRGSLPRVRHGVRGTPG